MDTKTICIPCGKITFNSLTHAYCLTENAIGGVFTGVVFNQISKKLIYQFKYHPNLYSLSSFIGDLLYESIIQQEGFNKILKSKFILVPIPLSAKGLRKNGYNPAELLAKELAKKLGCEVKNVLMRTKDISISFELNRAKRRENLKGVFRIDKKFENVIENKNIILIDDILVTGSTMSEACYVLKKNGVGNVYGIAFTYKQ